MKIRIDTEKFTVIELEDWLDLNSDNIDFDSDLYDEIDKKHLIDPMDSVYTEVMQQILQQKPTSYTGTEMLKKINKKNFKDSKFKEYISFYINSKNEIDFKESKKFSTEKFCYSFQLFEAIMRKNQWDYDKTIFNFYLVTIGGKDSIVFIIANANPLITITPTPIYDNSGKLP